MKKIDSLKNYYKRITKKNNSGKKGDTIKNIKTTIKKNTKSITQKLEKTKIGKTVKKYGNKIKNQMKKTSAKVSKTFKSALKKSKKLGKSLKEKYKKTKAKITKKTKSAIARLGKTSAWKTIKKYKNKFKGELKKTKAAVTKKYKSAVKKIKSSRAANAVTKSKKTGGILTKLKDTFIPTCYAGEISSISSSSNKKNAWLEYGSKGKIFKPEIPEKKDPIPANIRYSDDFYTKLNYFFPDGVPLTENEMKKYKDEYMVSVRVPLTSKSGKRFWGDVWVHKDLANDVSEVFQNAANEGYKIYDIGGEDEKTKKMTGGYAWREKETGDEIVKKPIEKWSMHSLGLAIDINPQENPKYENYTMKKQFETQIEYNPENDYAIKNNDIIVTDFDKFGWTWGGSDKWTDANKDYMHFTIMGVK